MITKRIYLFAIFLLCCFIFKYRFPCVDDKYLKDERLTNGAIPCPMKSVQITNLFKRLSFFVSVGMRAFCCLIRPDHLFLKGLLLWLAKRCECYSHVQIQKGDRGIVGVRSDRKFQGMGHRVSNATTIPATNNSTTNS